jgi:hypothetical protein
MRVRTAAMMPACCPVVSLMQVDGMLCSCSRMGAFWRRQLLRRSIDSATQS